MDLRGSVDIPADMVKEVVMERDLVMAKDRIHP